MYDYMNGFMRNQPQQHQIIRVNGENGARAFRMMPNSQALLLDETASIVWLCQSDGAGYHTVTPYSITPYEQPKGIDYRAVINNLDERLRKLEGANNDESNITEIKATDTNVGIK